MVPAVILFIGLLFCPKSPRWLAMKGRWDEAREVLAALRGEGDPTHPLVVAEFLEIEEQVRGERKNTNNSWSELAKPKVAKRVALGCLIQAESQLTGMNCMSMGPFPSENADNSVYYIVYVMQGAGVTSILLISSIQYIINVVMTLPAIIYIDRWGRRPILMVGALLMCFWLFLVGGIMGRFGADGVVSNTTTWMYLPFMKPI